MYFWSIHRLKDELQRGQLAPLHAMRYLMGIWLLFTLGASSYWLFPVAQANVWDFGMLAASGLAVLIGVRAAYRANGGADGVDFLGRFHALAWVVGWRVLIPTLALIVVGSIAYEAITKPPADEAQNSDVVGFAASVISQVVFYSRVSIHMRDVTQFTEQEPTASAAV